MHGTFYALANLLSRPRHDQAHGPDRYKGYALGYKRQVPQAAQVDQCGSQADQYGIQHGLAPDSQAARARARDGAAHCYSSVIHAARPSLALAVRHARPRQWRNKSVSFPDRRELRS